MLTRFEKVNRFKDVEFNLPVRKTAGSAGYDFVVAEDTIVPPYNSLMAQLDFVIYNKKSPYFPEGEFNSCVNGKEFSSDYYTLDTIAKATKESGAKPTLVSTGVKAYMPKDMYLELSVRSSTPLKHWLILANSVGIIDSDYYYSDNEGHIFVKLTCDAKEEKEVLLKKGSAFVQGIFVQFGITYDDDVTDVRNGGFGSTDK